MKNARDIPRTGRLLIADEVRAIFHISRSTLDKWVHDGKLPKPKDTGTVKRFWKAEEVWAVYDRM